MQFSAFMIIGLLVLTYGTYRLINPVCAALVSWVFAEADSNPGLRNRILVAGLIAWLAQIISTPFIIEAVASQLPTPFAGGLIALTSFVLIVQTAVVAIHIVKSARRRE